jgi:hypothetical protein
MTNPLGKRAQYAPPLPADDPTWTRFTMPVILWDGLARTGVLDLVDGHLVPVAAPLSIRRIDLYQEMNDLTLRRDHGALELYSTPVGFAMAEQNNGNRAVATTASGRVVTQLKDIRATVIGYIDAKTGRAYSPDRRPVDGTSDKPAAPRPTKAQFNHVASIRRPGRRAPALVDATVRR